MIKIGSKQLYVFLFFIILCLFSYRDFLWTYRSMVEDYFSYYHYQDQIIYYLTGDKDFKDFVPVNTRFLGLIFQFLIFKIFPCLTLTEISNAGTYPLYHCTSFSLALMNFFCKNLFFILIFLYSKKITSSSSIAFLSVILSSIFFLYLESFSLDRLAVLYILICLYFNDKKIIGLTLLFFSFFVNEKIIMVLGPYFLFQYLIFSDKKNLNNLIIISLSSCTYFLMIFFLVKFFGYEFHPYYEGSGLHRIFLDLTNKSHISNSFLPFIFTIIPYLILIYSKNSLNLKNTKFEILIPFIMWFLSYGGGENNVGRYVMHTLPIWLPLFSAQILNFLNTKNILKF